MPSDKKRRDKFRNLQPEMPLVRNVAPVRRITDEPDNERPRIHIFDAGYFITSLTQILVAIGAIGLALYFVYHLINNFSSTVTTTKAFAVTESEYREAVGYIIRDEKLIGGGMQGVADYTVADGERVAVGDKLADLYPKSSAAVCARIAEIDREIALLELANGSDGYGSDSLRDVTSDISLTYTKLMRLLAGNDYKAAAELSDTFRTSLDRFSVLGGIVGSFNSRITELRSERSSAAAALGSPLGRLTAAEPGYFFYECDGYEEVFTASLVENFTFDAFENALAAVPSDTSGQAGKLVTKPEWYVAVRAEQADFKDCKVGQRYNIRFDDNGGIGCSMLFEKYTVSDDGEILMLFSSSEMPENFVYLRLQNVRIEYKIYNGYRVPVSAVRSFDGMTGVYTLHGGNVYFRKINILYESSGYYIVSGYEDIEPGRPATYRVMGFDPDGKLGDYESLFAAAEARGWEKTEHDNGGIPVKYGLTYLYYYYLDDLEDIILTGDDLYHGKVLG